MKTTESKTIAQWLRRQSKQLADGTIDGWKDGVLMPIVGNWEHLVPKGMQYLFSAHSSRWSSIIDRNHESRYHRGRWKTVSRGEHRVFIVSVAVANGRKLQWLRGPSDVVMDYVLPEGWEWRRDEHGFAAIDVDGHDFHPTWTSNITVNDILIGHAMFKARRIAQRDREQKLINERVSTYHGTQVLLEDSRRAGNCVEGSLSFAEKRLGISRDTLLAAPHLVRVPAERLIATLDDRALSAVRCAYERETTVSI